MQDYTCTCTWVVIWQSSQLAVTSSDRSASTFPVNNFYLAEPQQMISLTPKKQQKQVAGKTLKKFIDKECIPKKPASPQKIPGNKLQKKHFTKMQKHVGLASTKNQPNKMGLTWQYVLRLPSLHRSFQPHTPQSPLPTYHPYSITHTTQHTTHSPSQLYTQNSLNTHHKLLVHIPQLFPYSASSINATAWSHSTPQTLTSTSKQILHYNKHLHHSCWYLKGTVYKAMASCENCEN